MSEDTSLDAVGISLMTVFSIIFLGIGVVTCYWKHIRKKSAAVLPSNTNTDPIEQQEEEVRLSTHLRSFQDRLPRLSLTNPSQENQRRVRNINASEELMEMNEQPVHFVSSNGVLNNNSADSYSITSSVFTIDPGEPPPSYEEIFPSSVPQSSEIHHQHLEINESFGIKEWI